MRKRWNISSGFLMGLFVIWALGWIPIGIAIAALTTPCDQYGKCGMESNAPGLHAYGIFMICWLGVVIIPGSFYGLGRGIRFLWNVRPHREWVSVEDLRDSSKER